MSSRAMNAQSRCRSFCSASGMRTRVPPAQSVPSISWADTSKERLMYWRVRAPAPTAVMAIWCSTRLEIVASSRTTPLGAPVDPEV